MHMRLPARPAEDPARTTSDTVVMMGMEAGRDPYDKALTDLVGELSTRSEDFRTRWAAVAGRDPNQRNQRAVRCGKSPELPGCRVRPITRYRRRGLV